MKTKLRVTPLSEQLKKGTLFVGLGGLFVIVVQLMDLDVEIFVQRFGNLPEVLMRFAAFDITLIPSILSQTLLSICLAFSALVLGAVIAYFLAILAAENLTPSPILSMLIKACASMIRAVPALAWILMVVASVGFGNIGGVLGLVFPTVGYLTKSYAAAFEEDGDENIEALKSTGARWINIVFQAVTVDCMPKLISWTAIHFENNVASGISLGMVGVSGVGYLLNKAMMKFDYPAMTTILVVIFLVMFTFECGSQMLKKRLKRV